MAISISSPVDGENDLASSQFYASGTSDDPNMPCVYAYITNGGQPIIGMMVSVPPSFVFAFQNVPAGNGYVLTVQDFDNPPNSDAIVDLTVV